MESHHFQKLAAVFAHAAAKTKGPDHLLRSPLSSEERITFQPLATDRQFIFRRDPERIPFPPSEIDLIHRGSRENKPAAGGFCRLIGRLDADAYHQRSARHRIVKLHGNIADDLTGTKIAGSAVALRVAPDIAQYCTVPVFCGLVKLGISRDQVGHGIQNRGFSASVDSCKKRGAFQFHGNVLKLGPLHQKKSGG